MSEKFSLDAARGVAGLALARAERMSGTGASATVRLTGILKFAPDRSETELLDWFQYRLMGDYGTCFPRFRELGEMHGSFVTELEYVGDVTLEAVLVGTNRERAFATSLAVDRVVQVLMRFSKTVWTGDVVRSNVLQEICGALESNARAAGISSREIPRAFLEDVAFVPCLCHRDLSVVNVVCSTDGGVRLIDPRVSIPGGERSAPSLGSSAIDAAAFLVSLERKELERARLGLPVLGLTDHFRAAVTRWTANGLFNAPMLDLCLAHAYSVYVACRCDYCLAPEREWLYDLMRERFKEALRWIA